MSTSSRETIARVLRTELASLPVALGGLLAACGGNHPAMDTVAYVEPSEYAGLWYEIAKIPNRFQDQCATDTTAEYTLLADGTLTVRNRCRTEAGEVDDITGTARVVTPDTNAQLKVSFVRFLGRNWFWGDYWIIGLDDAYEWAVVGTPSRKFGWILARSPSLTDDERAACDEVLREQGYDPADFEETVHTE